MVFNPKAGNSQGTQEAAPESWYNFEQLMNQRFSRMVAAEEEQDWWKYFVNFKFICYRLMPHMHPTVREGIAKDFELLYKTLDGIETNEQNDLSKKTKANEIRRNFVDTHQAYLFDTLPNAGLANIKADGDVDWNILDFKTFRRIIRDNSGMKTAVEVANQEDEDEP